MGIPTPSAGGPFAPEKMEARVGYRRPGPGLDRGRERGATKKLRFGQNNKDVRNVYFAVILLRSATTARAASIFRPRYRRLRLETRGLSNRAGRYYRQRESHCMRANCQAIHLARVRTFADGFC